MSVGRVHVGGALLVLLAASPRAGADRCAPSARITGDDAVASLVATELGRLGVLLGAAAPDCPGVDAQVRADGRGGVAVTLRDGERTDERDLGAPAVAAAWIDAWLRDDLDWRTPAPLALAPAPAPAQHVAQLGTEDGPGERDRVAPDEPTRGNAWLLARASLAAGYEQSWTGDGAAWHGFGVAACGRFGEWCFGGRARLVEQSFATGATGVARSDLSALATASYAVPLGTLIVAPELGLGVGRMSTARAEPCDPPPDSGGGSGSPNGGADPAQPPPATCGNGDTFVGDHLRAATLTPRGSAAVRVSVPLFAHVWLDGYASAAVAPLGHGDPFAATKPPPPGSGVMPMQLALPGEPLASFQLGIGLRVGAP